MSAVAWIFWIIFLVLGALIGLYASERMRYWGFYLMGAAFGIGVGSGLAGA